MKELIVFTHNDLDALGCMLNLEFKFPDVPKKYYFTNYSNIVELTDEILAYQKVQGNTHIVMPDVSFADNKESIRRIYEAFDHVTHIDHHLYPDGFWDEFPNMKVVYDKSKCATAICNEYLGNKGQNSNLDKLTFIIDIYDMWRVESPHFNIAQDLNEYFWKFGTTDLCDTIIQNDYKLPGNYVEGVNQIHEEFNAALADYEQRGMIMRSGQITLAFVKEWFNQILIKEMNAGKNFVIGINSWGLFKIRIKQDAPYTDEQLNKLRLQLTGTETTGHMHAFTYKIDGKGLDAIMAEAQKVTECINNL